MSNPVTTDNPPVGQEFGVEATVIIGEVKADGFQGKFLRDGLGAGIWTDYQIHSRFEKDRHIYMMPISSPNGFAGTSCAFVQLAAPTLLWIADWTACKLNTKPEIPDPIPSGSNWVLLDDWYEPFQMTIADDGTTPLWRISGTYIYGCKNPSAMTVDDITFPRPPWLKDVDDRSVPQTLLQQGLINKGGFKLKQPGIVVKNPNPNI